MPRGSIQNLFTDRTGPGALAAPSILAADFGRMGDECAAAVGAGADLLHVDIMDGHFVDNLTMGPDMVKGIRRVLPSAFLDVHLMVTNPERFVEPFRQAGADHLTFHVEVAEPKALIELAERVRGMGATAGIAINPPTAIEKLWPVIDAFELVLVMSVNPGRGGQAFIPETLEKTRLARERVGPFATSGVRVEMDGGIGPQNAKMLREAGCDVLVAGSAFFGKPREQWSTLAAQIRGG
jgi:ribulose-phosphate 3-epimerase